MKVMLRYVPSTATEYVELAGVPREGDEIHWDERIVRVHSVKWFPLTNPHVEAIAACLYVSGDQPDVGPEVPTEEPR